MAARLQTGDLVVVISGKNKGRQGKIARILADYDRVVVEGVNLIKRHLKPTAKNRRAESSRRRLPCMPRR
jgi:large subunit ribosomal protein L24